MLGKPGRPRADVLAHQQGRAQARFQCLDLPADGRLRQAQILCRGGDRQARSIGDVPPFRIVIGSGERPQHEARRHQLDRPRHADIHDQDIQVASL